MVVRKTVAVVMAIMFLVISLSVLAPLSTAQAAAKQSGDMVDKTMWCNLSNNDLYEMCQDKEFMKGLTAEQKKDLDREWERRIPSLSPAERQLYYPEGRRYSTW